jgi:hypothetical protein
MVLQVAQHHGSLAQTIPANGIDVVTAMGHCQGKTYSFLGTVLADDFSERLKLLGGFERQIFQNTGFVKLVQRQ